MAITVNANPVTLSWADFDQVAQVVDPIDGTPQDSVTAFAFDIPDRPPRVLHRQIALAETFEITITPNAQVRIGANQTLELLSHEQFHYDVGIVIGRRLGHELGALRAPDVPQLRTAMTKLVTFHFQTRALLIQRRYDIDTRHGTNAHYQKLWKGFMRSCLANTRSSQIHGFWL
jgi:hypothetical protein